MLQTGDLDLAFRTYWNDMDSCIQAKAYWSLLHVTVCLPDICAALQSAKGESSKKMYIVWCEQYFNDKRLSGDERYLMRCKLLHQGRAKANQKGRYGEFAFGQPDQQTGYTDHMRVCDNTLHVDVGELATETKDAVEKWIKERKTSPKAVESVNVVKNLPLLVSVNPFVVSNGLTIHTNAIIFTKTN